MTSYTKLIYFFKKWINKLLYRFVKTGLWKCNSDVPPDKVVWLIELYMCCLTHDVSIDWLTVLFHTILSYYRISLPILWLFFHIKLKKRVKFRFFFFCLFTLIKHVRTDMPNSCTLIRHFTIKAYKHECSSAPSKKIKIITK